MKDWFKKLYHLVSPEWAESSVEIAEHSEQTNEPWWEKIRLEENSTLAWKIGECHLILARFGNEYHIAHCHTQELEQADRMEEEGLLSFKTYTFKQSPEISLKPVLADRFLASKLARPFYIPAGQEILLYVSSPVWIEMVALKPRIHLAEVASSVLSDTWFGRNKMEGDLCYAGKTFCATRINEVPHGPNRIISPLLIKNRAPGVLILKSVSVPLPFLSVYHDKQNHLWTEQLTLIRERSERGQIKVSKGPPRGSSKLELISRPRTKLKSNIGFRHLFHTLME